MKENMLDALKQYEYISFDVFDTLLMGKPNRAEEVCCNVERRLTECGFIDNNYAYKRKAAEEKALQLGKKEITFDDIYTCYDGVDAEIDLAKQFEVEEEDRILKPNIYLKGIIEQAHRRGQRIVIISDMYLSADVLKGLLQKKGFFFDFLFVSSEYQARKSRGHLFDIVIKELGIKRNRMVHLGDNRWSDFIMPQMKGIHAIHWNKGVNLNVHADAYKKSGIGGEILYEFLAENVPSNSEYFHIGYELFGPTLLGFCQWINEQYRIKEMNELCFLARDGQIVRKAYQILYPGEYSYFFASRRSLTVPMLVNANSFADIIRLVPYIKRTEKIKDLLYKIGIEDAKLIDEVRSDFGEEISREELLSDKGVVLFRQIECPMKANAQLEMIAAKRFIEEKFHGERVGIVDIGWYGTMQTVLRDLLSEMHASCTLEGLYFGFLSKPGVNDNLSACGYIYDFNKKDKCYSADLIYGFNGLIELMFTADHGSAKKYHIDADNEVCCILEDSVDEYSCFVQEVQSGALQFITDWMKNGKCEYVDKTVFFAGLEDLLVHPTKADCISLGELQFFDAYFEKLVQYPGLMQLIKNPRLAYKNLLKSNWKIGYIKKMLPFIEPSYVYRCILALKKVRK